MSRSLARRQSATVALLFVGYAAYYLCRSDLSVAMPMLINELSHRGMSASLATVRLGAIVSFGVLAYALGKLFLTGLGDLWGGRTSFLTGLSGAVVFTVLFAAGGGLPIFTVAWIGNRLVQSIGWAGLVKICSKWFDYTSYGGVLAILSLSFLVGDAVAREWLAVLIARGYTWQWLFYLMAIAAAVVLLANLLFLRERRTDLGFSEPRVNPLNLFENPADGKDKLRAILLPFLTSRSFGLVCFLSLGTTIVRETFNTWTPTYLHEFFHYGESSAASTSAVFPSLGAVSVLLAGVLGDRLGACGRSIVMFIGMGVTTVGLFLLSTLSAGTNAALPWILIGLVGFGLLGPYSYLAGAMALDFGGKRGGATSSGLIDGVGYLGGILAGDSVARISVHYGWNGVFVALAALSAVSALAACLLFLHQQKQLPQHQQWARVQR